MVVYGALSAKGTLLNISEQYRQSDGKGQRERIKGQFVLFLDTGLRMMQAKAALVEQLETETRRYSRLE
eukprot:12428003-Karenia_brevis.AAC.1